MAWKPGAGCWRPSTATRWPPTCSAQALRCPRADAGLVQGAACFPKASRRSAFAQKLLLEIHPREKLGAAFFADLVDSIADVTRPAARNVATFALAELARFDLNSLERALLQRLLLHPLTRAAVISWINQGTLKAQAFPVAFLKALAFHPAWDTEPSIVELRRSERAWARGLDFSEPLADQVLGWLGDVRRFAASDLGFDWLMQLVDRSEPRYHDFAVETMIKAFTPADFAPQEATARPGRGRGRSIWPRRRSCSPASWRR